MLVLAAGPAGSGNMWMREVLRNHPDITSVEGLSFPSNTGAETFWPGLTKYDPTRKAPLLVLCRDRWCAIKSQIRRGFHDLQPEQFTDYENQIEEMSKQIAEWEGPVIYVSYECLYTWGRAYMEQVFRMIGVDPNRYPWEKFDPANSNEKYQQ